MEYPGNTVPQNPDDLELTAKKILLLLNNGGSGGSVPATPGSLATNAGANHAATGQSTSTNAAVKFVNATPTQRGLVVENTDGVNSIWVGPSGVTALTGKRIAPGASLTVTATIDWYVIDNGAHAAFNWIQEYD